MKASRSSEAGTNPIREIPSSLRRISSEKLGGVASFCTSTSVRSTTRVASTTDPALVTARNRDASEGAVPEISTKSPSVSTCAQLYPAASNSTRTKDRDRCSMIVAAPPAITVETTTASAKAALVRNVGLSRMCLPPLFSLGCQFINGRSQMDQSHECGTSEKQRSQQPRIAVGAEQMQADIGVINVETPQLPPHMPPHRPRRPHRDRQLQRVLKR